MQNRCANSHGTKYSEYHSKSFTVIIEKTCAIFYNTHGSISGSINVIKLLYIFCWVNIENTVKAHGRL